MAIMTTWRELITDEMEIHGDSWDGPVRVAATRGPESLDEIFNADYGRINGGSFTVWTQRRVYFPLVYDGAEWCGSVPRHPCDEPMPHQGSE